VRLYDSSLMIAPQESPRTWPAFSKEYGSYALIPVLGAVLGVIVLALEHVPEPVRQLSALGGPWLVVAFVCGAVVHRKALAGPAGVVALAVATGAYYGGKAIVGSPINPPGADETPGFWLVAAVIAGAVFGLAGAIWASRSGPSAIAVVALATVFMWDVLGTIQPGVMRLVLLGIGLSIPLLLLHTLARRAMGLAATVAGVVVVGWVADVVLPSLVRFR
jgi:hypothetical protein